MNNRIYRQLATVLLFLSAMTFAKAQGFTVKVRLCDKSSGSGIEFATVSVSRQGSTDVLKYTQTDREGRAVITGLKGGKYTFKGILLGYQDWIETVNVTKDLNLGQKQMDVQVNALQGAVVSDVGNPIVVKKDTIEHNVSLMQSTDSDMLEDILKRLPGIEVSNTGAVTANGKEITKVFIDGKSFFLDDPQLATKNLPAKIINKVKVVNKKSEQAEFTGIDDGDEEMVLDLSIKKGMMDGWMGNVTGGVGTDLRGKDADGNPIHNDLRAQGGGMLAKFTESNQIVAIGNANNTNNRGFNDITGNAVGGMRGGRGMRGGNNGIATSYMAGLNGSLTFGRKSEVNGNYLFDATDRVVDESTDKTTFKEDGTQLHYTEKSTNVTNTRGHRAGIRLDWKASRKSSILFNPQFNYGWGDFSENTEYATSSISDATRKVNDGRSLSVGHNTNKNAKGRLLWRQRIGEKKGRTLSMMIRYEFNDRQLDGNNNSTTNVYVPNPDDPAGAEILSPESAIVDQEYNQNSKNLSLRGRLSYTEPLGGNFFAEASYAYRYSYNTSDKETYGKDAEGRYTVYDENYSSSVRNTSINQTASLSLKKQEKKYNLTLGASYQPSYTKSLTTIGHSSQPVFERKLANWSPNARLDLNFGDNNTLRLNYRGRTGEPSVSQLQPVPDNSNPLSVILGNPNLTPSFSHNFDAEYRVTDMETFASFNTHANMTYTTNNIVNSSYYGSDGVQYTIPMNNADGYINGHLFAMVNAPIARSKFSIMSFTRANYSRGVNLVGKNGIDPDDSESYLDINNYSKNRYRSLSINETLRGVYRDDIFEASIGGGVGYSQSWYSITSKNVDPAWTNNVQARFIANIPGVINVSTDCRYTFYAGYAATYNDPMCVWNAEISKTLFRNQATLAIRLFDILGQSRNVIRTAADNYVLDTMNNTLGRYFLVSLTWRFGKFGENSGKINEAIRPRGRGYNRR